MTSLPTVTWPPPGSGLLGAVPVPGCGLVGCGVGFGFGLGFGFGFGLPPGGACSAMASRGTAVTAPPAPSQTAKPWPSPVVATLFSEKKPCESPPRATGTEGDQLEPLPEVENRSSVSP